ncbi:MAG: deoxyribodipyrimidine photo-lyase [Chlorobiaceae bacterium]|nr:deoxyribodipyrimidine photo-lyase [Chlorobiaceae bacterium]
MDPRRITLLSGCPEKAGTVVYWMSRDQRVQSNWALLFARHKAAMLKQPLVVVFTLSPSFLGASPAHYRFMLKGLQETETGLVKRNIPFFLLFGDPAEVLPGFLGEMNAGVMVTDYSPMKISRQWKAGVSQRISIPLYEVDAHNIVPCRTASQKQEYAARTFRPKITALLGEFLKPFPEPSAMPSATPCMPANWPRAFDTAKTGSACIPPGWPEPGEKAAGACLASFLSKRLRIYGEKRNDPNADAISHLSPYLHFGHISAQECALRALEADAPDISKKAFFEELVIRRELSDNYCQYNEQYDSFDGIPAWAKESLEKHARDPREHLYGEETFAEARTHDRLWNAAQRELLETGKIHGYMRMYWAKKILEWSASPEKAFDTAVALNDRYALDGRDPNGYTGVAWSIGGVHDRPWFERPVFGKIRYMNAAGCARKFDAESYIRRYGS